MYTNSTDYETYTGTTAPVDYGRQELYAITLFKSVYPNFPSEEQYEDFADAMKQPIEYAIFEQISEGINYTGTTGQADSFSVGNFSIAEGGDNAQDKLSFMAVTYLTSVGATYKGVGAC